MSQLIKVTVFKNIPELPFIFVGVGVLIRGR